MRAGHPAVPEPPSPSRANPSLRRPRSARPARVTHDDTPAKGRVAGEKVVKPATGFPRRRRQDEPPPSPNWARVRRQSVTPLRRRAEGRAAELHRAARPEQPKPLYEAFVAAVKALGLPAATGRFGATMQGRTRTTAPSRSSSTPERQLSRRVQNGITPDAARFYFPRLAEWHRDGTVPHRPERSAP